MSLKERVGESLGPLEVEIDPKRVRVFSLATGWEGSGVPPTFLTVFRQLEFDLFDRLGIPLSKVLHAEQEYEYCAPLEFDSKLQVATRLGRVLEKKGSAGGLTFIVVESEFKQSAKLIALARSTVVVRGESSS